MTVLQNTEHRV